MDDEFAYGLFSDMGIKESGSRPHMAERSPLQDLEKSFRVLFDEKYNGNKSVPLLVENNLSRFFVEEKKNYFVQVASNIKSTRDKFLKMYETINGNIDFITQQVMWLARNREQELKDKLKKIAVEKVRKWNQQVSVCEDALKLLKRYQAGVCDSKGWLVADSFWNEELTRQLEFVDAGEITFERQNYQEVLQILRNLGKISCHIDSSFIDFGPCSSSFRNLTPKFLFGESGAENGQFCRPWGVCSDPTGRILVCDRSNHRIQIFNECGEFLLTFGKEGSEPGEFNRPSGVDVDCKCRIVVADKDNHRIQIFTYSGHYLLHFGEKGSRPGQFMYPWDVSVSKNCDIAVSDSKNHRIQLFNEKGLIKNIFDAKNMASGSPRLVLKYLDSPRGLAFTPNGSLLVTDFNNHRILLISADFKKAKAIGCEGNNLSQFFRPQGIACDNNDKFAVADCKNYRIQVFDLEGNFCMAFGTQGTDPGQFDCPQGICFHPNKNIVVVDLNNNRVQVF